jgi:hypothetical protein
MIINDVFSLFYFPILYFGFLQLQHLFGPGILGLNGFIALVFILTVILLPFIWIYVWVKKTP